MKKLIISLIVLMIVTMMQAQQTVKQTYLTLNNGVQMPQFGLGVYSIADGEDTYNSVMVALSAAIVTLTPHMPIVTSAAWDAQ